MHKSRVHITCLSDDFSVLCHWPVKEKVLLPCRHFNTVMLTFSALQMAWCQEISSLSLLADRPEYEEKKANFYKEKSITKPPIPPPFLCQSSSCLLLICILPPRLFMSQRWQLTWPIYPTLKTSLSRRKGWLSFPLWLK